MKKNELHTILKEVEDFSYLAIHDLKAPLRGIDAFTKLLHKKNADNWDEKDLKYLDFINESSEKLRYLIQDLLDFFKICNPEEHIQKLYLKDIAKDSFRNLTKTKNLQNASLKVNTSLQIEGNRLYFTTLFNQLIDNALTYHNHKRPVKIDIDLDLEQNQNLLVLKITDNGIGIEQEYFDEIFKPLKRLHNYNSYKGTGLGLAICKKIVDNLKGSIIVSSNLDKGSTFMVKIPM